MSSSVSSRLVAARKSLGVTQGEFCEQTGMSLSTLKKYEGGHSAPGTEALGMMAKTGINIHWLVTGIGQMMASAPDVGTPPPAKAVTKINVDALVAAFEGVSKAAPPGQAQGQILRQAIELYMFMLDRGMITPDGVGKVDLGNAA